MLASVGSSAKSTAATLGVTLVGSFVSHCEQIVPPALEERVFVGSGRTVVR